MQKTVRAEKTTFGEMREHEFWNGYDLWGYDENGMYDSAQDLAPFQSSPFPNEHSEEVAG